MGIFNLLMLFCYIFELGQCFGNSVNVSTFLSLQSEEQKSQKYKWNDIRLPKSIIPLEYDVFIHPNLSEWNFSGKVEIRCEVRETTDFIVLHSKDLIIADITVRALSSSRIIKINRQVKIDYADQIYIEVEHSLSKDTEILLTLGFEGILEMGFSGFYVSQYFDANNITRSVASTQFEPIEARKAFPCFDEPELKANFSISIVREKDHISLFNMPLIQSLAYSKDLMLDTFQQTVKMSTYTVAFAVCKYASKSKQTKSGINVTVYSPEDQIGNVDYSLNATLTIFDFYNSLYEIPYPLPKLDMIAIPHLRVDAMENWGLVTYKRTYLNVSEETSYENKFLATLIVSHEIAHQWFGNIVTMKWWSDLWLNEGMTTFMSYLGLEAFNKEWTLENTFIEKLFSMMCEDTTRTRSLNQPVDIAEFSDSLYCVLYAKGASLLRMVRRLLGKEPFLNGIKEYLRRHLYSNVDNNHLWEVLSTFSKDNVDVRSIMKTWMSERSYPVVTVIRDGPTVHVSQDVFIFDHNLFRENEPKSPPRWCIPFIYGVLDQNGSFSTENLLLCEKSGILQINNDTTLVKGNFGDDGYYRVNYDHESWKALAELLKENHTIFPSGERAQLLSDVLAFTSNTILNNTSNARALMNYLEKERSYLPWRSVSLGVSILVEKIEVTKENEYGLLVRKYFDMATNALADVGCRANTNEMESLGRVRELLISVTTLCPFGEPRSFVLTAMRKAGWTYKS